MIISNRTINILYLVTFGFLFNISLYISSPYYVYLILSLFVCGFYTYSSFRQPEIILSFCLSSYAPLFYSVQYIGIPYILLTLIVIFMIIALINVKPVFMVSRKLIFLPIVLLMMSIFPHVLTLEYKSTLIVFLRLSIYTILPMWLLYSLKDKPNILSDVFKFSLYFNTIILASFIVYYFIQPFSYFVWKIESQIGISFLAILNILIIFFTSPRGKWIFLSISLLLMIIVLQRAFLLAFLIFIIIVFLKNLKKYYYFIPIIIVIGFLIVEYSNIIISDEKLYKLQFLANFGDIIHNINDLFSLSKEELTNKLGSIGTRFYFWEFGISYSLSNNFLLGNGIEKFQDLTGGVYPHNILVDYLFSFGFIGLIFFVLFFIQMRNNLINVNKDRSKTNKIIFAFNMSLYVILLFSSGFERSMFYNVILLNFLSVFFLLFKEKIISDS